MLVSAYTLHCTGELLKQYLAAEGKPSADAWQRLPPPPRRRLDPLDAAAIKELRVNRYDEQSKVLKLTAAQAWALEQMRLYWDQTFLVGDAHYGFLPKPVFTPEERKDLKAVQAAYRLLETPVTPSQRASAKFFLFGFLTNLPIINYYEHKVGETSAAATSSSG